MPEPTEQEHACAKVGYRTHPGWTSTSVPEIVDGEAEDADKSLDTDENIALLCDFIKTHASADTFTEFARAWITNNIQIDAAQPPLQQ
jgi:hypothetical protein